MGLWQQVGPRAAVLHGGPLTRDQRWWCALLNTGSRAVLAGVTATEAAGLRGYESEAVHVKLPKGARHQATPGVVVHTSRRHDDSDVHPLGLPPRCRTEVALVDAALWSPGLDRSCAILAAGVQQRLVLPGHLRARLEQRRGPQARLLLRVVDDIAGGSQSLAELDVPRLCRRAGLPVPVRQQVRADSHGRRRYLDCDWPEWSLSAEVDGALHMLAAAWWADMTRQNEITLGVRRVLRFPSIVLRLHPEVFTDQVRRGLRLGGWPG